MNLDEERGDFWIDTVVLKQADVDEAMRTEWLMDFVRKSQEPLNKLRTELRSAEVRAEERTAEVISQIHRSALVLGLWVVMVILWAR